MTLLKTHLQAVITAKIPEAFVAKRSSVSEIVPTGIPPLDSLIQGFPQGALTEIYGPASSGRTTIALAFMTTMTRRQQVCAVIDVSDALDPESLAAAGADLNRVLWVRCGTPNSILSNFSAASSFRPEAFRRPLALSTSCHPRDEVRGLSQAIANLMGNAPENSLTGEMARSSRKERLPAAKSVGSFLKTSIPLSRGTNPEVFTLRGVAQDATVRQGFQEQVSVDRQPPRRGDRVLLKNTNSSDTLIRLRSSPSPSPSPRRDPGDKNKNPNLWASLEQALKATDLLLHNGGFGAVIMDLGDVPPANALRIPLATWFRFRRAVENTPAIFLLLTREPCTQNCASLVLHCRCHKQRWGQAADSDWDSKVVTLDGLDLEAEIMRHRALPQDSRTTGLASWQTRMWWTGSKARP